MEKFLFFNKIRKFDFRFIFSACGRKKNLAIKRDIVSDEICAMYTNYQNTDIVASTVPSHQNEDRRECSSKDHDECERRKQKKIWANKKWHAEKTVRPSGFGEHVHFKLHVILVGTENFFAMIYVKSLFFLFVPFELFRNCQDEYFTLRSKAFSNQIQCVYSYAWLFFHVVVVVIVFFCFVSPSPRCSTPILRPLKISRKKNFVCKCCKNIFNQFTYVFLVKEMHSWQCIRTIQRQVKKKKTTRNTEVKRSSRSNEEGNDEMRRSTAAKNDKQQPREEKKTIASKKKGDERRKTKMYTTHSTQY